MHWKWYLPGTVNVRSKWKLVLPSSDVNCFWLTPLGPETSVTLCVSTFVGDHTKLTLSPTLIVSLVGE